MAAREGSYGACRALLDAHANREITDHMERLPRDVAAERVHDDIVRLLDEHAPRAPPHPHSHHHALLSEFYLIVFYKFFFCYCCVVFVLYIYYCRFSFT